MSKDPELYWIGELNPWRLAFAPRPRGGEGLVEDVAGWKRAGIRRVVSLLLPSEEEDLLLQREPAICKAQGIAFERFPIPDRSVPPSFDDAGRMVARVVADLRGGGAVLLHCRVGIGRSALITAAVMFHAGCPAPEIFPTLTRIRGRRVPDTPEQFEWLFEFASRPLPR